MVPHKDVSDYFKDVSNVKTTAQASQAAEALIFGNLAVDSEEKAEPEKAAPPVSVSNATKAPPTLAELEAKRLMSQEGKAVSTSSIDKEAKAGDTVNQQDREAKMKARVSQEYVTEMAKAIVEAQKAGIFPAKPAKQPTMAEQALAMMKTEMVAKSVAKAEGSGDSIDAQSVKPN